MFEFEWSITKQKDQYLNTNLHQDNLISKKSQLMLIEWQEHCHECSPPLCYSSCKNYLKRKDNRCQLIKNGISPVKIHDENNNTVFGAKLLFRKWSKLETYTGSFFTSKKNITKIIYLNFLILKVIKLIYEKIPFLDFKNKKFLNAIYTTLKSNILLNFRMKTNLQKFNYYFVFKCDSLNSKGYNFIFESDQVKFAIPVKTGLNTFKKKINPEKLGRKIKFFPENDFNADVTISYLEIIRNIKKDIIFKKEPKVVVWDLDNTLWDGVLIEDGSENIKINNNIIKSIIKLESLGIVNSIISKNDHKNAWSIIKKYDLDKYFVFPKINWNPKSQNMQELIKDINVNPDTFIFVDDNPFERAEVQLAFPEIVCVDENDFPSLLANKIFDMNVTNATRNRTNSYKSEEIRKKESETFNSFEIFLESCNLEMKVTELLNKTDVQRAFELLNRTNQLNLSATRYNEREFKILLNDKGTTNLIFRVNDKFGDYGIVGFISYKKNKRKDIMVLKILNFVMSCRVMKKYIENALVNNLIERESLRQNDIIIADYKKTERNSPILESFIEVGFKKENDIVSLNINDLIFNPSLVKIK